MYKNIKTKIVLGWKKRPLSISLKISIRLIITIALIAAALSLIFPLLGMLYIIVSGATILMVWLKKISIVESLFISFLLLLAAVATLYSITAILRISLPQNISLSILSLLQIPLYLIKKEQRYLKVDNTLFNKADFFAIIVTLSVLAVLLAPIARSPGTQIARFMSYGEDNASHYAMLKYNYQKDSYSYFKNPNETGLIPSLSIYPQGMHAAEAVTISAVDSSLSESKLVKAHSFFVSLIYAMMSFWAIKIVLLFINSKKNYVYLLLTLASVLLLLGPLLSLLSRGFHTQIISYAFAFCVIYIMTKHKDTPYPSLLIMSLMFIGIAASWWFLLLSLALPTLLYFIKTGLIKEVFTNWKLLIPIAVALALCAFPVLISMLMSEKTDPINEPGGVDKINITNFLYLSLPVLLALALSKAFRKLSSSYFSVFLFSSVSVSVLLSIYQMTTVGELRYYYFKSILTVYIGLIIISLVAIGFIYELIQNSKLLKNYPNSLLIISLLVTIGISINTNMVHARVYANDWYNHAVDSDDLNILFMPHITNEYDDIYFIGDCETPSDYLSNRWSGAILLSETEARSKLSVELLLSEGESMEHLLDYNESDKHKLFIVDNTCGDKFSTLFKEDNLNIIYTGK